MWRMTILAVGLPPPGFTHNLTGENNMQIGLIGAPMARNLLKAGFALTVATRTPGKAEKFAAENPSLGDVKAASTSAEVAAASEITVTMVTDSPDVVAVARGGDGVFAAAKP